MKPTLDRILILATAGAFLVGAHFFPDQAIHFVGLSGLLIGVQIPYGQGQGQGSKG